MGTSNKCGPQTAEGIFTTTTGVEHSIDSRYLRARSFPVFHFYFPCSFFFFFEETCSFLFFFSFVNLRNCFNSIFIYELFILNSILVFVTLNILPLILEFCTKTWTHAL